MPDLTSSSPFSIATSRAKRLLQSVEQKITFGQISTRVGLLATLTSALSDFVNTLTEPSLTVPYMSLDEILIKEFVSDPVAEADSDCQVADEQVSLIRDTTKQILNTCQAERAGLQESLSELTNLMNDLRLWISDSDTSFLWVGDHFKDSSKVDAASTVFLDTTAGTCVLQPDTSVPLSKNIVSITIDKKYSEGGIPGNNMEIRAPGKSAFTGEQIEPRPILYDDTQPTPDDLTAVLDGNPNTWFEWERIYVPIPQPAITAHTAFVYDSAGRPLTTPSLLLGWSCFIKWPGDIDLDEGKTVTIEGKKKVKVIGVQVTSKKTSQIEKAGYPIAYFKNTDRRDLLLGLTIELDQPRNISWIQLTPFLRQSIYPQVDQILISSDGNQWRKVLSTPTFLTPRINKGVDFTQEGINSAGGFEGIGVWHLPKSSIKYVKILMRQVDSYSTNLGIGHRYQVDKKGKHRVQPPVLVVGSFKDSISSDSTSADFSTDTSETAHSTTQFFDILRADRQVIGIRDLLLESRTYKTVGQLTSTALKVSQPAKYVALLVSEQVPKEWPTTTPDGKHWIEYEVSSNNQIWKSIRPQVAELKDSVVVFDEPTTTIYFRATFSRPDNDTTSSPILYSYALKCLP